MVGPQVGKDLREKALFAMFFALLFIAIYISGRFEFKWILSGVMAAALFGAVYVLSLFQCQHPDTYHRCFDLKHCPFLVSEIKICV